MIEELKGRFLQVEPFPVPPFHQLSPMKQFGLHEEKYTTARNEYLSGKHNLSFFRYQYMSDGLRVSGFLCGPKKLDEQPYPVIFFNRGGNRELDTVDVTKIGLFQFWVDQRFIVIGSQYRGCDGGEGYDEFGGRDVQDIFELEAKLDKLSFVDQQNKFMLGYSRGGMMTYLALKKGIKVNAAAIVGGNTDLFEGAKARPEMETYVFSELIPEFKQNKTNAYKERSALYWAEQLNTPTLILHGTDDGQVSLSQAKSLAEKLKQLQKDFQFSVFEKGNHPLSNFGKKRDQQILSWFQRYTTPRNPLTSN